MRLKYEGPHRAVHLSDGTRCERGKHTDVDDGLAERLVARDDFTKAPTPKSRPEPTSENDEE